MANHIQAKKRIRQNAKRKIRNAAVRTTVRRNIKNVRTAVEEGDKDSAATALKVAVVSIDRMVTKNVIKRSTASRSISRLTKSVNKI